MQAYLERYKESFSEVDPYRRKDILLELAHLRNACYCNYLCYGMHLTVSYVFQFQNIY